MKTGGLCDFYIGAVILHTGTHLIHRFTQFPYTSSAVHQPSSIMGVGWAKKDILKGQQTQSPDVIGKEFDEKRFLLFALHQEEGAKTQETLSLGHYILFVNLL